MNQETLEEAAEKWCEKHGCGYGGIISIAFETGAKWQSSQPNPHRITEAQMRKIISLWDSSGITLTRMVEILNEIAAGKHKEKIEI
jgi:hypothetical protein